MYDQSDNNNRIIEVGTRVNTGQRGKGYVAYIGSVPNISSIPDLYGVILDEMYGDCDGTIAGVSYFKCPKYFGCFVFQNEVDLADDFLFPIISLPPPSPHQIPLEETINIVVLGEVGVGKTTFITNLLNLTAHSLMGKCNKKPYIFYPNEISGYNQTAPEPFHILFPEQSVAPAICEYGWTRTDQPISYPVTCKVNGKRQRVRLIDTPGVGDSRGHGQDEYHFQQILNHIIPLNRIHAFCVMLTPESTSQSPAHTYFIRKLSSVYGPNVLNHVKYCFTNWQKNTWNFKQSRGEQMISEADAYQLSCFRDPIGQLHKSIQESIPYRDDTPSYITGSTTYKFDNQAIRNVRALTVPNEVTLATIQNWERRWNIDAEEMRRLMKNIQQSLPFRIGNATPRSQHQHGEYFNF